MNSYRHSTDRIETVVIAGCPAGCQAFEVESKGQVTAVDQLVETLESEFGACSKCGEPIGFLRRDEPTEVLD